MPETLIGLLQLLQLAAPPALADDGYPRDGSGGDAYSNSIHGMRLDIHGNVDRWGMLGLGGRVELPLVPQGLFRSSVHDEFALSLGADLLFAPTTLGWSGYYGGGYVVPIAAVQWNLYFGDRWSIFPELGLAVHLGFDDSTWSDPSGRSYGWIFVEPNLGIGGRFNFSPRVALLTRLSTPGGFQLGLNF